MWRKFTLLALDSPRWADLSYTYGNGAALATLLRKLIANDKEVSHDIWQGVCHQGSIYSASIAAVPHLVQAAEHAKHSAVREMLLILIGSACSGDYRDDKEPPGDVQGWYEESLPRALALATKTLRETTVENTAIYLLMASASLKGMTPISVALEAVLIDGELIICCPECDYKVILVRAHGGLHVVSDLNIPINPGPNAGTSWSTVHGWLLDLAASNECLKAVTEVIPHMFGELSCPECATSYALLDQC